MTLAVPQLGPSLGQLIVPHRLTEPWVSLDDVREALATRVIECAGAARRDAADAAPARALRQLDREAWSGVWEEAVRRAAERVAQALDATIGLEARRVRMPARRAKQLVLSPGERRAISAASSSTGSWVNAVPFTYARRSACLPTASAISRTPCPTFTTNAPPQPSRYSFPSASVSQHPWPRTMRG